MSQQGTVYRFHVTLHARPPEAGPGDPLPLASGQALTRLDIQPQQLALPMAVSFEQAVENLSQLPRMFVEPDGSLVWVSPAGQPPWQVDGNLFDRNGRLLYVDLKGSCPPEPLGQLLAALGHEQTRLMFQLVQQAVFLDEGQFRRYASQHGSQQAADPLT